MTTVTLESLLTPETEESIVAIHLAVLQTTDPPFPVTDWSKTGVAPVFVRGDARSLAKVSESIPKIARAGYLTLAAQNGDEWLDLKIESDFQITRIPAKATQRQVRLTNTTGAPVTINAPGERWVRTSGGLRFRNVTTDTIPPGGYRDLIFEAESPGQAYNASTSGWFWVTPLAGVTLADGPAGITSAGADKESNAAYVQRAIDRWGSRGVGAPDGFYRFHTFEALKGTPFQGEVTRVKVRESYPNPGDVTVLVASGAAAGTDGAFVFPSGPGTLLDTIQQYLDPADTHLGVAPNCVDVHVASARFKVIALTGIIARVSSEPGAQSTGEAALSAWAASFPIGGATVSREQIIRQLMSGLSLDPRNDVELVTPAADVVLAADEIPVFDVAGLSWVDA